MADIRSLLRNELAQRRINHSQATYTATGTLECIVCRIPLKPDAEVWNKHLKSTQHAMRAERLRLSTSKPPDEATMPKASNGSRKRKASDGEDGSKKKTRPVGNLPGAFLDEMVEVNNKASVQSRRHIEEVPEPAKAPIETPTSTTTLLSHQFPSPNPATTTNPIDEDEWAAFERDVANSPSEPTLPSALTAEATISAAPMTAAELAAQSREQADLQGRERREAEIQGEKEDAARALEEEFDEMEGLQERVRKLREMREALRKRRAQDVRSDESKYVGTLTEDNGVSSAGSGEDSEEGNDEEEDDGLGAWSR